MVNQPAGATTISGQVSHSLKVSFGLSARSCSGDSGATRGASGNTPTAGRVGAGGVARGKGRPMTTSIVRCSRPRSV